MTPTITDGVTALVTEAMSVTVACTRCGEQPYHEDLGYSPVFGSAGQAIEELTDKDGCWNWHVVTRAGQPRELICDECACAHLGHQPRTSPAMRTPDGVLLGPVTVCDRCGELLAAGRGEPAPPGYPATKPAGVYLEWNSAALPDGGDIARAAARVLGRLCDIAEAARWDAFDGPQDGRPEPSRVLDRDLDAEAARTLTGAAQRLLSASNPQEAL